MTSPLIKQQKYSVGPIMIVDALRDPIGRPAGLPDCPALKGRATARWRGRGHRAGGGREGNRTTVFAGCAIDIPMAVFLYRPIVSSSVTCAMPLRLAGSAVGPGHTAVRGPRVRTRRSRC